VSADTDFGELLANAPVLAPSVILLRRADKRARSLAAVVLANLEQIAHDLAAGALIVISDTHPRTATPHEAGRLRDYPAHSLRTHPPGPRHVRRRGAQDEVKAWRMIIDDATSAVHPCFNYSDG
jgi:Domain of unknown function (DUF5615)